jgi:hypothetical protein
MAQLDFTRQQRVRMDLEKKGSGHTLQEWTDDVQPAENVKYARACPLTDKEIVAAIEQKYCGPIRKGDHSERLAYRFKKDFTAWDKDTPLCDVPEIELALHAMLACSLNSAPGMHFNDLYEFQALVQSYWDEVMSVFSTCLQEIRISTCPEIEEYRRWLDDSVDKQPIFLIPTGDVNHTRARFYAYPKVWEVFATVFGEQYAEKLSFYCTHPNAPPESGTRTEVSRHAAAVDRRSASAPPSRARTERPVPPSDDTLSDDGEKVQDQEHMC